MLEKATGFQTAATFSVYVYLEAPCFYFGASPVVLNMVFFLSYSVMGYYEDTYLSLSGAIM
jgi:hypothetical protein